MNENSWVGNSCPTTSKKIVTSKLFKSYLGSTLTLTFATLGSKFSIVVRISDSMREDVPKSARSKMLSYTDEPKIGLKNLSQKKPDY